MRTANTSTTKYGRMANTNNRRTSQSAYGYVHGSAVPKRDVRVVEDPRRDPLRRMEMQPQQRRRRGVVGASRMSKLYVSFLTVAAVLMITMCYQFLTLQSAMNEKVATISSKEVQLANLKAENDFHLVRMEESLDLEQIRLQAMERLGMVEPTQAQIITYSYDEQGYMRQFSDVPSTDGSSILKYFDE